MELRNETRNFQRPRDNRTQTMPRHIEGNPHYAAAKLEFDNYREFDSGRHDLDPRDEFIQTPDGTRVALHEEDGHFSFRSRKTDSDGRPSEFRSKSFTFFSGKATLNEQCIQRTDKGWERTVSHLVEINNPAELKTPDEMSTIHEASFQIQFPNLKDNVG